MSLSLVAPPVSGIDMIQLSYLQWLENQEADRYAKYAQFRDYYEGEHATQLTARMRKFLELTSSQEFSLNYCPIVVDSLAEKLKVTGFDCEKDPETLWEWWRRSRMDAVQAVVHSAAIRDGDTYLLGEWSNEHQRPYLTQENAYDGTQGVHIVYSDERRNVPMVAIKRWIVTSGENVKTRRTNLYYPDRIEKYTDGGTGSTWMQYEEDGQAWPIPWPLGIIPIIHFRNKDQGYSYGESELEDVVPVQNGANKTFIDLLAAADTAGFRMYAVTGANASTWTVAPGSILWYSDKDARITALDGEDPTGLIKLCDSVIAHIAKITRTPLSYFQLTGQVAAEGTLKQQEAGLVSKARDRQTVFGNSWEDAMYLCRKLHNQFSKSGPALDEDAEISTLWMDPESRNEKEHFETLKLKRESLEIPRKTLWAEAGYDAQQIERMEQEADEERAAGVSSLANGLLEQQRRFDQGTAPVVG